VGNRLEEESVCIWILRWRYRESRRKLKGLSREEEMINENV
jgi:hypothetical protein